MIRDCVREDMPRPSDATIPTGAAAVGQMLREARESLGLGLEQVAEDTRIRQHLLEAIEDGRFGDLPGSAYAPAFLRGYASCVGLDVDRVMQVYRSADNQPVPAPVLHFPVVPPERRVPRGALMLASACLLVCAYVTWHALTRDYQPQDVRVPPVPQRLLADQKPVTPPGTDPAETTAPAPSVAAAPPPTTGVVPPAGTAPAAAAPVGSAGATPPPAAAPPAPAVAAAPPPMPVLPNTPPATAPAPAPAAAAPPARPAETAPAQVAAKPPARPAAAPPASTAGADAPPQQATAPTTEPSRTAARPRVLSGPVASQARTVRADVDSTLQLKGADGEVLATTYLRAGSTYTVPEHVGFVLAPAQ
jgi:cytoskeleton protein RodZ